MTKRDKRFYRRLAVFVGVVMLIATLCLVDDACAAVDAGAETMKRIGSYVLSQKSGDSILITDGSDSTIIGIGEIRGSGDFTTFSDDSIVVGSDTTDYIYFSFGGAALFRYNDNSDSLQWSINSSDWYNMGTSSGGTIDTFYFKSGTLSEGWYTSGDTIEVGSGGSDLAVEEGNSQVDDAVTSIDFGAGFDLTEDPTHEINVVLDLTEDQVDLTTEVTGELPDANVANDITASNYLPLAGGAMTGSITGTDSLDLDSGLYISDDITITGTVDGVDVGDLYTSFGTLDDAVAADSTNWNKAWDSLQLVLVDTTTWNTVASAFDTNYEALTSDSMFARAIAINGSFRYYDTTTSAYGPNWHFIAGRGSGESENGDEAGNILFRYTTHSGTYQSVGAVGCRIIDTTEASANGEMFLHVYNDDVGHDRIVIHDSGSVLIDQSLYLDAICTDSIVQTAYTRDTILSDSLGNYQPLEVTLTDIADGTIAENLVNTDNPWADNEIASSGNWNTAYGWGDHSVEGYLTTETGDISNVTAGNGLTGGGATGSVSLAVGAGNGITANADDIEADTSVVATKNYVDDNSLGSNSIDSTHVKDSSLSLEDLSQEVHDEMAEPTVRWASNLNVGGYNHVRGNQTITNLYPKIPESWYPYSTWPDTACYVETDWGGDTTEGQVIHPGILAEPIAFGLAVGDSAFGENSSGNVDTVIATVDLMRNVWVTGTEYPYSQGKYENAGLWTRDEDNSDSLYRPYVIGTDPTDADAVDTVWVMHPLFDSTDFDGGERDLDHCADVGLYRDPSGDGMWIYFLAEDEYGTPDSFMVLAINSANCFNWDASNAVVVLATMDSANNANWELLSPQIVPDTSSNEDGAYVFFVDETNSPATGSSQIIRVHIDSIGAAYDHVDTATVDSVPNYGAIDTRIWHIYIDELPFSGMFIMIANLMEVNASTLEGLPGYIYYSYDRGLSWSYQGEVIPTDRIPSGVDRVIYKSHFIKRYDFNHLWLEGYVTVCDTGESPNQWGMMYSEVEFCQGPNYLPLNTVYGRRAANDTSTLYFPYQSPTGQTGAFGRDSTLTTVASYMDEVVFGAMLPEAGLITELNVVCSLGLGCTIDSVALRSTKRSTDINRADSVYWYSTSNVDSTGKWFSYTFTLDDPILLEAGDPVQVLMEFKIPTSGKVFQYDIPMITYYRWLGELDL